MSNKVIIIIIIPSFLLGHTCTDELKLDNARGQSYDGAAVISRKKAGVATQIKAINSKCLYTHCYGNALNVSVKDACTRFSV